MAIQLETPAHGSPAPSPKKLKADLQSDLQTIEDMLNQLTSQKLHKLYATRINTNEIMTDQGLINLLGLLVANNTTLATSIGAGAEADLSALGLDAFKLLSGGAALFEVDKDRGLLGLVSNVASPMTEITGKRSMIDPYPSADIQPTLVTLTHAAAGYDQYKIDGTVAGDVSGLWYIDSVGSFVVHASAPTYIYVRTVSGGDAPLTDGFIYAARPEGKYSGKLTFERASGAVYMDPLDGLDKVAAPNEPRYARAQNGRIMLRHESIGSTNLIRRSEDLDTAPWVKRGVATVDASAVPAPFAGKTMQLVSGLSSGMGDSDVFQDIASSNFMERHEPSLYLMQDSITSPTGSIRLENGAIAGPGKWKINMALVSSESPERITRDHHAVTVVTEFLSSPSGAIRLKIMSDDNVATSAYVTGVGVEPKAYTSSYIPNDSDILTSTRASDGFMSLKQAGNVLISGAPCSFVIEFSVDALVPDSQFLLKLGSYLDDKNFIELRGGNLWVILGSCAFFVSQAVTGLTARRVHKLIVTQGQSSVRCYLDGRKVRDVPVGQHNALPSGPIKIGDGFNGFINFKIYDFELSEAEARA